MEGTGTGFRDTRRDDARPRRAFAALLPAAALAALLVAVAAGCCTLGIDTDSLPPGDVGSRYRFELSSDCGGDFWFLSQGTLPPGVSLSGDGELSGVPSQAGEFLFTIGLEDYSGDVVFKGFSLIVRPRVSP